ncbi:MAG: ectoine hydroxylase [Rhizobiales bacterium NRL2]|jgi:ectoine hydroxylase|nr:MAG: ectoine hydroxylase [Rhizobiales bacterium NRL2]
MEEPRDPYPSRRISKPYVAPRTEPVIHAHGAARRTGPLDDAQLDRFERDGFLFLPELFPANEVRALRARLDRLCRDGRDSEAEEIIREPENDEVRSIFAVHQSDDVFARLADDPRLADAARQILGSDVYVHQSRINYKPAFAGTGFFWHSDFETWHCEDGMPGMRAVSMSILLTDNTPHNGPLMLIPGSHRHFVGCVGETPEENHRTSLRRQVIGTPDTESLKWLAERGGISAPLGPCGSVLIFDCNTLHGSADNISPDPRSNVFMVFNSVENRLRAPYAAPAPRPWYLASRRNEEATAQAA